jgi:hypothetical protein
MNQDLIVDKEHTPISSAVEYSALDSSRPPAVICDLDGTLALITDRDPYDAEFCINDQLNVPVADLIKAENKNGAAIVLVSGRSESSRSNTIAWLKKYDIHFQGLFMRPVEDFRKDAIVKREIYDQFIDSVYSIKYVLDDRDQVVDMWRNVLKLPCFQVNYGSF